MRTGVLRVGVMGGSFNPPHYGHIALAKQALKQCKLDYVILLVARQNPFKNNYTKSIAQRAQELLNIVDSPKLIVSTAENEIGTSETYFVLKFFTERFSNVKFTWLMGVDNILHFKRWSSASQITKLCDVAIFDRPCAQRMINLSTLYMDVTKPFGSVINKPSMGLYRSRLHDISSTNLRLKLNIK